MGCSPDPVPLTAYHNLDETTLATVPGGGALSFSTAAGLAVPGTAMEHKPHMRLKTGNEAGSNARPVTRPE